MEDMKNEEFKMVSAMSTLCVYVFVCVCVYGILVLELRGLHFESLHQPFLC
jgi:hypothetical protein